VFQLNIEEEELIRKSRSGDEKAFEQLVQRYYKRVWKHVLSVVKDVEKAEDLTQETFIKAFQKLSQFQGRSHFYTWVWKISHNLSLNALKKEGRSSVQLNEAITAAQATEEAESIPMELFEKYLTEKQKAVFTLYYNEHLSQKEIAYRLNIPHGTVRSRLHCGKECLKQIFQKGG